VSEDSCIELAVIKLAVYHFQFTTMGYYLSIALLVFKSKFIGFVGIYFFGEILNKIYCS
jgi:hypothetical protein